MIHDWLFGEAGNHPIPGPLEVSNTAYIDITPSWMQGHWSIQVAQMQGIAPLLFGLPPMTITFLPPRLGFRILTQSLSSVNS